MAYVPNPTDVSQPTEDKLAQTAAAEFRALKAYVQQVVAGGGPGAQTPGMIADFPYDAAPAGWIIADGQLRNRADFAALWAFISGLASTVSEAAWAASPGSFSVGDGSLTFRVPDFRGTVRRSVDNGRGLDPSRSNRTFQDSLLPAHAHLMPLGWDSGGSMYLWNDTFGNPAFNSTVIVDAGRSVVTKSAPGGASNIRVGYTQDVIASQTQEVRVRNTAILTCIKT